MLLVPSLAGVVLSAVLEQGMVVFICPRLGEVLCALMGSTGVESIDIFVLGTSTGSACFFVR